MKIHQSEATKNLNYVDIYNVLKEHNGGKTSALHFHDSHTNYYW